MSGRPQSLRYQTALFRDVLGLQPVREEPGLTEFRLDDGTRFEVYAPGDTFHAFFRTGPVVGFEVPDFDVARQNMQAAAVVFIGSPQHEAGVSWQHFHLPGGTIAVIIGRGQLT